MNTKNLITKTIKEVEYENKFDDLFFSEEYPMPFFSKELRKKMQKSRNIKLKQKKTVTGLSF